MRGFQHSYNRRCHGHDCRSRCIYMITILKSAEAPLFSRITADPKVRKASPLVELYPAAEIIHECLDKLCIDYPALRILCRTVMPDHLHFEIFVTEKTDLALGSMIASFKSACTLRFKTLFPESSIALKDLPMFQPGFNDKIAFRAGAKDAFYNYISDNPRRYLIKNFIRIISSTNCSSGWMT